MIAQSQKCIQREELVDWLAGRLPAERFASVLQHVESCPRCIELAEQSNGSASYSWIARAVTANEPGGFNHEPECEAVVGQLLIEPFARQTEPQLGTVPLEMLGPYRLLKWLGSGGMGAVYLAEHQRLKRLAAIKLLPREKLSQSGWLERFNREMTSIAALEHPNVVRAMDAGDEGGWHFLVMEYLDGLDLSKVCRRMGPLPLPTACEVIRQAALGLSAIHSLGMTHRDIKPSNLFLTKSGSVKLLDLGLVLSGDSPLATDERLTTVGHLMGTLPYMSREQLLDASTVDWRADIYSLGATFVHLLTGRAPFGSVNNLAQMIQTISVSDCPPLASLRADIPDAVAGLVDRMLSHSPSKRPQSAQEIAEELQTLADSASTAPLVRAALNRSDDSSPAQLTQLSQPVDPRSLVASNSGNANIRWPLWIALMLLPLAFAAGIILTLTTDNGTLVIESDQPGVSVKVSQGEKIVESLRVDKQPSVLRLSSGKYLIEVSGAEGEDLQISDTHVALMRGDKQVVKITKRTGSGNNVPPIGNQVAPSDGTTLYQGQPLAHWMDVFDHEKDVGTLAKAMQAIQQLAETDSDKLFAARSSLKIARRLGGMIMTGRPEKGFSDSPSGWFMTELMDLYPKFFPEPGLQAIIEELEQGNARSGLACILLLSVFPSTNSGFQSTDLRDTHFLDMAKSPSRAQLTRLDAGLERLGKSLAGEDLRFFGHVTMLRYSLIVATGKEPSTDQELIRGAQYMLADAETMFNGHKAMPTMRDRSPLSAKSALVVSRILPNNSNQVILLGLLENTFDCSEQEVIVTLSANADAHPRETAQAVGQHIARTQINAGGFGMSFSPPVYATERAQIAMRALLAHPPESLSIVKDLMRVIDGPTPTIFSPSDFQILLREFALRLAREANSEEEQRAYKKLLIVAFLTANYGLVPEHEQETILLLLKRYPKVVMVHRARMSTWSELMDLLERQKPSEFDLIELGDFQLCLKTLFEKYPAEFLAAYTELLELQPYQQQLSVLTSELESFLNANTPPEHRLYSRPIEAQPANGLSQLLATEQGKALLEQLESAYSGALDKFTQNRDALNTDAQTLSSLLMMRLKINVYRQVEPKDADVIKRAFKLFFTSKFQYSRLGMALYFTRVYGYDELPFPIIPYSAQEISRSEDCEAIKKLIQGLHQSRPDEFCNYFLGYIEEFVAGLEKTEERARLAQTGGRAMSSFAEQLFGGLDAHCAGWYREILNPLLDNPATRERTVVALKRIVKSLPPGTEYHLQEFLPK